MEDFTTTYQEYLELIENKLKNILSPDNFFEPFQATESMRYSLLAGGKRIRPIMTFAVAKCFNLEITDELIHLASCVEMIHNYSLIHDDLPAMDDDSLRRGKPTNHIIYGEGMAVLGGDALLNLAYENLFELSYENPKLLKAAKRIAYEAGVNGMIGGQSMDLSGSEIDLSHVDSKDENLNYLKQLQDLKTGALIRAAVLSGYYYSEINALDFNFNSDLENLFIEYANYFGLIFQIRDDLLDVLSDEKTLGKSIGKDSRDNKLTFVSLLGIEDSKKYEKNLQNKIQEVLDKMKTLHLNIEFLNELTRNMFKRKF